MAAPGFDSVWQYPRLGNACAWQLSADQTPAYALAQDWPCCTESLPQPCIYGLSPRLGLKLELLRLSIGFESLELGLKLKLSLELAWLNLELKLASMGHDHELPQ